MVKVLLVNSSNPDSMGKMKEVGGKHHPLGLLYIASVLLEHNYNVKVCDELVDQSPEKFIEDFVPDFVGISVRTPAFNRAIEIAARAKSFGAKVILGGPHVSALPVESLKASENIDGVIVGEGEYAFLNLVSNPNWSEIKGLVYKEDNKIITNPPAEILNDLDLLPFPARHLLEEKSYYGIPEYGFIIPSGQNFWTICSSRGCPFKCTFCSSSNIFGRKLRYRSAKNIFDEIIQGYNKGVKYFVFIDDSFGLNKKITSELCNLIIKNNLKITWCCQTRVTIPLETMLLMKQAGCILISYGVESGSKKILENIEKGVTKEMVRKGIENAKKAGLLVKAYFIVGLPGEGEKEFRESLKFAKSVDIDYLWLSTFTIFPGSYIWESYMENKDSSNINWDKLSYFGKSNNKNKIIQRRYTKFLVSFFMNPRYLRLFIKRINLNEIKYFLSLFRVFIQERLLPS